MTPQSSDLNRSLFEPKATNVILARVDDIWKHTPDEVQPRGCRNYSTIDSYYMCCLSRIYNRCNL